MDTLERIPLNSPKAIFDKLLEVADVANLSKDERILYDEALKRYRDYKNTIDYAEEKGIEKGIEKGRQEGIEIGKAAGKAEGLTEGKLLVAANLKKRGMDIRSISECTGLSEAEIEAL